ncbi:MAG: RnfABCDGE type electron transport complex subunit B, partial [Pseudomonadales bacterium]|nr:RnfABCDGE type electron transport complex subunit B [Pseudomonadales bacterium]
MILGYLMVLLGCALLTFGVVYFGQRAFPQTPNVVEDLIYRTLPQTQCAQCGYPGCRPYAAAVAKGEAINRCPPGGEALIQTLADLLNRPASPLASELKAVPVPLIARIQESNCIGCMLCIKACPVDAIIGSQNLMHTVIESECTGCELCLPPCPVDCIDLIEADSPCDLTLRPESEEACIFCSDCVTACPKSLTPQHLFLAFDHPERSAELG